MLPAREWLKSISISTHLTLGMLLRLILIAYGDGPKLARSLHQSQCSMMKPPHIINIQGNIF